MKTKAMTTEEFMHRCRSGRCDRCRDYGSVIVVAVRPAEEPIWKTPISVEKSNIIKLNLCDWCQLAYFVTERQLERRRTTDSLDFINTLKRFIMGEL